MAQAAVWEPARMPAGLVFTSRTSLTGAGFKRLRSAATAPNVYLMLYPRPSLSKLLKTKPALNQAVWQALNQIPVAALVGEGRVYGGGLYKIEPKELGNAPAEGVVAALGARRGGNGRQELLFW